MVYEINTAWCAAPQPYLYTANTCLRNRTDNEVKFWDQGNCHEWDGSAAIMFSCLAKVVRQTSGILEIFPDLSKSDLWWTDKWTRIPMERTFKETT